MCVSEWFELFVFLVVGQFHHANTLGRRRHRTHTAHEPEKFMGCIWPSGISKRDSLIFVFAQLNTTNNGCRSFSHNIMNLFSASKNHFVHSRQFSQQMLQFALIVWDFFMSRFASACVCEISSQQIRWWMRNVECFALLLLFCNLEWSCESRI